MRSFLKFATGLILATVSVAALAASPTLPQGEPGLIIDDFRYASDAAAQQAWRPLNSEAPAASAILDGRKVLRLRCNFTSATVERLTWRRKVKLDLSPYWGIQFKFFCKNSAPISGFSVHFQSGAGWYNSTKFTAESATGWSTVTLDKGRSVYTNGSPAGWDKIETISINAWRNTYRDKSEDTEFYVADLRMIKPPSADASIAILSPDSTAQNRPAAGKSADGLCNEMAHDLSAQGIVSSMLSDLDVTAERLSRFKLVILPHNGKIADSVANELIKFVNAGGKLLVFFDVPAQLRPVVKIGGGAFVKEEYPGYFSTIRFADGALPGAPPLVGQQSRMIVEAKPVAGASRVLAEWLDDKGQPTGHAAVVASENCIVMTQSLLNENISRHKSDMVDRLRMLLAMVGRLEPEAWRQTATDAIARMGQMGGCNTFDETAVMIALTSGNDKRVKAAIESARQIRDEAVALGAKKQYPEAMVKAKAATQGLTEAFCMTQKPLAGEFRAFWCDSAFGGKDKDWDAAIKQIADNGFTAVFPWMSGGGFAFYASRVQPVRPEVAERGDQIEKCLAACKKYGVQMHVWRGNFSTAWLGQAEFIEQMRREGRLQISSAGKEGCEFKGKVYQWLCPSHPENQKLEIASMVEVARNYDVDGLHFDTIRYAGGEYCFCDGCRERFTKAIGGKIKNWPQDVLSKGAYYEQWNDWRRGNITAVVKAVSEQARAIKPKIKMSAAVWSDWPKIRVTGGQDWKLWCEKGWLDFACPMNYTGRDQEFENYVASQKKWAGRTPVYPGITVTGDPVGDYARRAAPSADHVIGQIQITRRYGTQGFMLFNYDTAESRDFLRMLGLGITAKR
jgi:uncharacterized lipoprotein YddW (UPF0748 family)